MQSRMNTEPRLRHSIQEVTDSSDTEQLTLTKCAQLKRQIETAVLHFTFDQM